MARDVDAEQGEEEIYDDDTREELVEDDELSPEEEAFMKGYDEAYDEEDDEDDVDKEFE